MSGIQTFAPSTGTGRLEAARGTQHVADGDVELTGERDILGPWIFAELRSGIDALTAIQQGNGWESMRHRPDDEGHPIFGFGGFDGSEAPPYEDCAG